MFQEVKSSINNQVVAVQRLADGACIPLDPANADYAAYLEWVAAGGVPEQAGAGQGA